MAGMIELLIALAVILAAMLYRREWTSKIEVYREKPLAGSDPADWGGM